MKKIIYKIRFYYDESEFLCYEADIIQEGLPAFQRMESPWGTRGNGDDIIILKSIPYTTCYNIENGELVVSVEASELRNRRLYAVVQTEKGEQKQPFTSIRRGTSDVIFTGISGGQVSVYVIEE